ncbi:hypothetical protein D3C72_1180910 [compost metagenome]
MIVDAPHPFQPQPRGQDSGDGIALVDAVSLRVQLRDQSRVQPLALTAFCRSQTQPLDQGRGRLARRQEDRRQTATLLRRRRGGPFRQQPLGFGVGRRDVQPGLLTSVAEVLAVVADRHGVALRIAAHGVALEARDVLDGDHLGRPGRQAIQQRRQHLGLHRVAHLGQMRRSHHQHLVDPTRRRPLQLVRVEGRTIGLGGGAPRQS